MIVKYSFYFIGLLVMFGACKNNKQEIEILSSVNESLEASSKNLEYSSVFLYRDLEEKLADPKTSEQAKIWQPMATAIQWLSKNIFNYIDSLKADIKKTGKLENNKSNELYNKLKKYQQNILAVAPEINARFNESFKPISTSFDILKKSEADFYNSYFKNSSVLSTLTVFSGFQNNIKITENQMVTFCHSKIGFLDGPGFFTKSGVLVGQSTNHLKAGENLEITAGVGEFSSQSMPRININGKNIKCEDAVAHYKLKTSSSKVGKHSVPVVIEYTDQNGIKNTRTVTVEYIVDE